MSDDLIRPAGAADTDAIARIYNHYIRETTVTFEEEEVSSDEIAGRIAHVTGSSLPWLIVERAGTVTGYAYASRWHQRSAYRYSTESTIYLDHRHTRQGTGARLYEALLSILRPKSWPMAYG